MMSLFSTFDFYWSIFKPLLELFTLVLLFYFVFSNSIMSLFFKFWKNLMFSFFDDLNTSKYTKSAFFVLWMVMFTVVFINFLSVFPFNFAYTSQVNLVMFLGLGFWVSLMFFYSFKNMKSLASHLVPEGSPMILVPVLFLIEIISNSIRPLTVTVRLVANILAGHVLLILCSKLVSFNFNFIPLYILLTMVEFFVALIQSYIFTTMLALYYCEMF